MGATYERMYEAQAHAMMECVPLPISPSMSASGTDGGDLPESLSISDDLQDDDVDSMSIAESLPDSISCSDGPSEHSGYHTQVCSLKIPMHECKIITSCPQVMSGIGNFLA